MRHSKKRHAGTVPASRVCDGVLDGARCHDPLQLLPPARGGVDSCSGRDAGPAGLQRARHRLRHLLGRRGGRRRTPPTPARWPARWGWPTTIRTDFSDTGPGQARRARRRRWPISSLARRRREHHDRRHVSALSRRRRRHVRQGGRLPHTCSRGNPLPSFFARLVGIATQDMKATATAKVLKGNATQCMRPFGIMDKWDEWNDDRRRRARLQHEP